MKIKSIKATNFKSFSNLSLDSLLNMNLIFGYNNSGKSNLLRLIEIIFSRKIDPNKVSYEGEMTTIETRESKSLGNFWEGIIENHNYIFRFGKIETPITFEISFEEEISIQQKSKPTVKKKTDEKKKSNPKTLITIKGSILSIGSKDARQELNEVTIDNKVVYSQSRSRTLPPAVSEQLSSFNDSVVFIDYDRYIKEEIENEKITNLSPTQFRNWLFNLSLSNEKNIEFNKILTGVKEFSIHSTDTKFTKNELSNPFTKQLSYRFVREAQTLDIIFKNNSGEMPLGSFGTGVQQILYLLFKITEKEPKILLLEEIELNLSPKYQDILLKYFDKLISDNNKSLTQVFITSHSPLNCYRSQDRSLMATINENGETKLDQLKLTAAEQKTLKEAHVFMLKSVYGITE